MGGHTSTDPGYRSALHSHTTAGVQVQRRVPRLNASPCQRVARGLLSPTGPLRMRNAQFLQSIGSGIGANRDKKARGRRTTGTLAGSWGHVPQNPGGYAESQDSYQGQGLINWLSFLNTERDPPTKRQIQPSLGLLSRRGCLLLHGGVTET